MILRRYEKFALITFSTLILCVGVLAAFFPRKSDSTPIIYKDNLKVLLDFPRIHRDSLTAGYNYHLLEKFGDENKVNFCYTLGKRREFSSLDSLFAGDYDLLVSSRFNSSTLESDSLISFRVDSVSWWTMKSCDSLELGRLASWLETYCLGEEYSSTRNQFFRVLNPRRSRPRQTLSPYDDIIRKYADSLSWDWRRLAAIVYHESYFHIEARSHRGARGLMQLMPKTGNSYSLENPLDPEENIAAGCRLLLDLDKRYRRVAPLESERFKLVLAAYNAGVGRIKDVMNFAESLGTTTSSWDSLLTIIPLMNDSTTLDTSVVKLGVFKGKETENYVNSVNLIYSDFLRIVPSF